MTASYQGDDRAWGSGVRVMRMAKSRPVVHTIVVAGMIPLALLCGAAGPAAAQGTDVRDLQTTVEALIAKSERLDRTLNDLQKYVYAGGKPPAGTEAAPAPQVAVTGPTQVARLQLRLTELETQLRDLTGRVEEFAFKIDRVHNRLNKLVEDVDYRLTALERDISRGREMAAQEPAQVEEEGTPARPERPGPAPGPGVLGTLTAADLAASTRAATLRRPPEPKAILPAGTPEERYNFAFRLLRQTDYGDAEKAFHEFIAAHPDDRLAPNAQYWLGESFYVRKEFERAATAFLAGYQNFPTSPKAPDSLLKLGMSLAAIGEAKEACKSLVELLGNYPDAADKVRLNAEKQKRRIGCN